MRRHLLPVVLLVSSTFMFGCGGGGGGGSSSDNTTSIPASSTYAQQCAPDNPYLLDASTTTTPGSLTTEKQWIRSYFNEAYLWYRNVPSVNASDSAYTGSMTALDGLDVPLPLSNYFYALKTTATTSSGAPVDKFSFAYPTQAWNDLSQAGIVAGYGIEWMRYQSYPPRSWRVAMVQPGSPAANAGVQRGDTLVRVDGVDFVNDITPTGIATFDAGLYPDTGESHTLTFARAGSSDLAATMTASSSVTIDPVPQVTTLTNGSNKVGYIVFTDHIISSEQKLIDAMTNLKNQNITDLVLDLRYNGGGYLYIASEVAYMIAGPTRVAGKYFEQLQYNDKRTAENDTTPFYNTACVPNSSFACTSNQSLPTLNLSRVFVITRESTCSASESIINSLLGVDVQVIQIGGTTCGKPYGFSGKDNCGVTYFPIEFKGVNYKGFGEYSDGFAPVAFGASGANLPGCSATDDLDHALGDPSEGMLAATLYRLLNGSCSASIASAPANGIQSQMTQTGPRPGTLLQNQVRQNRILLPAGSGR